MSNWANIITANIQIGNAMAAAIDPDDGSGTFGRLKLRPIGSTDQTPSAYATSVPLTANGKALFDEFITAGPYPLLNAAGLANAQIAAAKAVIYIEHGDTVTYLHRLWDFATECGFEKIPTA